jgi:hypothetical protein
MSCIRSRAYSNAYEGPKGLKINQEGGNETSDLDSLGLSGIDQDLSSITKLRKKKFKLQANYDESSAFEESNKFESDFDFEIKSFLNNKMQPKKFKIEPTKIK